MAYIGATDLIFPAGVTISPTSSPYDFAAIDVLIAELGAEVEGYAAAAGYEVPISSTATMAYESMRRAVKNGVYGVVLNTIFPNLSNNTGDKSQSLASTYEKAYNAFKAGLASGSLILVGAASAGEDEGRVLPRHGGFASPAYDLHRPLF